MDVGHEGVRQHQVKRAEGQRERGGHFLVRPDLEFVQDLHENEEGRGGHEQVRDAQYGKTKAEGFGEDRAGDYMGQLGRGAPVRKREAARGGQGPRGQGVGPIVVQREIIAPRRKGGGENEEDKSGGVVCVFTHNPVS